MSATKQHWIPKLYLRGFAIHDTPGAEARIWAFPRNEGDPFVVSVSKICAQSFLYSPKDAQGRRSDHVEQRLAKLEATLGLIWPRVTTGYLSLDDEHVRRILALVIATLYLRNPQRRVEQRQVHSNLVKCFAGLPTDEQGNPKVAEVEIGGRHIALDTSDWQRFSRQDEDGLHELFASRILQEAQGLAEYLLPRRWACVVTDTEAFATSDSPVVLAHPERDHFGFRTPGVTVCLPLSPTRYLLIEESDLPSGYYMSKPGFPEGMNYQTWTNANRFLLSSMPSDEVLRGVMALADHIGSK
jgi:hypothetical protein